MNSKHKLRRAQRTISKADFDYLERRLLDPRLDLDQAIHRLDDMSARALGRGASDEEIRWLVALKSRLITLYMLNQRELNRLSKEIAARYEEEVPHG